MRVKSFRSFFYLIISYFCGVFLHHLCVNMFGGFPKECLYSDNVVRTTKSAIGERRSKIPPPSNIYLGMMSAGKYIESRVQRSLDTWLQKGGWKVEVFADGNSSSLFVPPGLDFSVIRLPSVNDAAYPPQKKCFMMIRHMYDKHIDKFDWFLRVDDDAYIEFSHLTNLLDGINSSLPIYLGSPGFGIDKDDGMEKGMFYLMGGPGVIISRGLLLLLRSRLSYCIQHMFSPHEDIELGRCVWKYVENAIIPIAWETLDYFYQQYDKDTGNVVNIVINQLKQQRFRKTLSYHAVKSESLLYQLHKLVLLYRVHLLLNKTALYHEELNGITALLNMEQITDLSADPLSTLPLIRGSDQEISQKINSGVLKKISSWPEQSPWIATQPMISRLASQSVWINWDKYYRHQMDGVVPMRGHSAREQEALLNYLSDIKNNFVAYSCPGFPKDSQFLHGYMKIIPMDGMLLATTHRTYADGKVKYCATYVQALYGSTFLSEADMPNLDLKVRQILRKLTAPASPFCKPVINPEIVSREEENRKANFDKNPPRSSSCLAASHLDRVVFIIPLQGRYQALEDFMTRYEAEFFQKTSQKPDTSNILLVIILLGEYTEGSELAANRASIQLLKSYQILYGTDVLQFYKASGEDIKFSRGAGLQLGSLVADSKDLIFFMDIDMIVTSKLVNQCRSNAVLNESAWYPIPYSQYDPGRMCYNSEENKKNMPLMDMVHDTGNAAHIRNSFKDTFKQTPLKLSENRGFWRDFGFGIACLYKLDFVKAGGFDLSIEGWGEEDIRMYLSLLESGLNVLRWKQSELIHVYHPKFCDRSLVGEQARACKRTKASHYASQACLAGKFFKRQYTMRQ